MLFFFVEENVNNVMDILNNSVSSESNDNTCLLNDLKNEVEKLKFENEKLKNSLIEKNELYLYSKAENENMKKRHCLESERLKKSIVEKLINEFFLLSDTMEYGLCFEKIYHDSLVGLKMFDLFVGLRLVYEMLLVFFERNKIKQLNPVGVEFNPNEHEVVMLKKCSDFQKKDVILEVVRKGYLCNDFLCRYAKVVISG